MPRPCNRGKTYKALDKISETTIRYGTKSQLQTRKIMERDEGEADPNAPAFGRA